MMLFFFLHRSFLRNVQVLTFLMLLLVHQTSLSALQWAAWLDMAIRYSFEEESIAEGIERTFSGKSPCAMCKAIEKVQKETNDKDPFTPKPSSSKTELTSKYTEPFGLALEAKASRAPDQASPPSVKDIFLITQIERQPPTPPPDMKG